MQHNGLYLDQYMGLGDLQHCDCRFVHAFDQPYAEWKAVGQPSLKTVARTERRPRSRRPLL